MSRVEAGKSVNHTNVTPCDTTRLRHISNLLTLFFASPGFVLDHLLECQKSSKIHRTVLGKRVWRSPEMACEFFVTRSL